MRSSSSPIHPKQLRQHRERLEQPPSPFAEYVRLIAPFLATPTLQLIATSAQKRQLPEKVSLPPADHLQKYQGPSVLHTFGALPPRGTRQDLCPSGGYRNENNPITLLNKRGSPTSCSLGSCSPASHNAGFLLPIWEKLRLALSLSWVVKTKKGTWLENPAIFLRTPYLRFSRHGICIKPLKENKAPSNSFSLVKRQAAGIHPQQQME